MTCDRTGDTMSKHINGFAYGIRVGWADCDPAAIAFTGRIPYWALEAIDAWWDGVAGLDWYRLNIDHGIGTPFVHMTLDFGAPVTPRHRLECQVVLLALGATSIRHGVKGYQDGVMCFQGEFVSVFVETKSLKSRRPPEGLRRICEGLLVGAPE